MKSYQVSVLPSHPDQSRKTDYQYCIVAVPRDYDGTGPMPRYFGGLANLTMGLMRLGIDESRRGRIEADIKRGESHHIAELSISDQQVKEFWWNVRDRDSTV